MEEPLLLLVEDDHLILLVAQEALESGGYAVIVAANAAEAISTLDERSVELAGLVTDVRLGDGRDGWDVARHARELMSALPVVYMTGDSAADWPVQGVPNSAVVQKPYAPAQLVTAISTLITSADAMRISSPS
jgi:DNA-binding response OmpR family regulator